MFYWRSITQWLGSLPLLRVTWALVFVLSTWAAADFLVLKVSSGLARSTYDGMVRNRLFSPARDPRIVIVDIDEASLLEMGKEFGRWPWPRDTLATVLNFIDKQGPAAIVWDIAFSDADRLSPGGDKAFDEAARRSQSSHFSVVRLPPKFDSQSQITRSTLPGLWFTGAIGLPASTTTVALIPPVFPAVAAAKLGYNNGYADTDGVLRRYRYVEQLSDGSSIQSLAFAVARSVSPNNADHFIVASEKDPLIIWQRHKNAYPRIAFSDVFNEAEGGSSKTKIPSFSGKIVLIGATASSLHDIHPTPAGAMHAGVDILATAIDNAVHGRYLDELPAWLQAALAIGLIVGMNAWVLRFGLSVLDAALLLLPTSLLVISYLSLNFGRIFFDLYLAAGAAFVYIAVLKTWNAWRRNHWCADIATNSKQPLALLAIRNAEPLADVGLDRLIRLLELNAPQCRIVGGDATATWPARLRWPEMLHETCVVGPAEQLLTLASTLRKHQKWTIASEVLPFNDGYQRDRLAAAALRLLNDVTSNDRQANLGKSFD